MSVVIWELAGGTEKYAYKYSFTLLCTLPHSSSSCSWKHNIPITEICIPRLLISPAMHIKIQTPIHFSCLVSQTRALPSFPNTSSYIDPPFKAYLNRLGDKGVPPIDNDPRTTKDSEHQLISLEKMY